ncbi:MAG: ABC transporter ATP-binding protein, partial [Eubacterium sp.]|nr:ABC transporter ATP-binding protein [Eubacterium sp.]
MKRFFKFIKPYRVIAILAPLLKLLEATLELFVPLIMALIIDKGIAQNNTEFILIMGAVLVGIAILGLCVSITSQYFSAKTATGFAADISGELFRHITKLSKKDYESIGTTSLVTRISSDVNQVQTGLNLALRLLLRSPFIVFGAMIMAFTVSASMAVIFVVIIPVLAVIVTAVLTLSVKSYKNVQKNLESVVRRSSENVAGIRPIRAFGAQKNEVDRFENDVNILKKSQMKNAALQSFLTPATFVVVNVGIIALIYGGGLKVDIGELSRGEVVALVNYMSQILVELVKLANLVISINKAITCFGRINEVLELPIIDSDSSVEKNAATDNDEQIISNNKQNSDKKISDQGEDDSCVLRFDNVSFTYPDSSEPTLKNISFEIKQGEKLGIIGGTGSGKSTVIKLITGEYPVNEGAIISGVDKQEMGV